MSANFKKKSLPLSKSFREIRLEGKWVPYSLQTVSRFFNYHYAKFYAFNRRWTIQTHICSTMKGIFG